MRQVRGIGGLLRKRGGVGGGRGHRASSIRHVARGRLRRSPLSPSASEGWQLQTEADMHASYLAGRVSVSQTTLPNHVRQIEEEL